MRPFGLTATTVDKGTAALAPETPPTYVCVASLQFESFDRLQQGLAQHGPEIMGDIPQYTDVQPVIQVSEVLL